MPVLRFRILNVFAPAPLAGNPLAVFEDARDLDAETMQALALQFNLSETTFVLPSERATARVRIFTPGFEMPFAGHPTLGTAHVVRELAGAGDALTLEMKAGVIPVTASGNRWTLEARPPKIRRPEAGAAELAQMLGVAPDAVGDDPLWIDTGSEQLVVPLRTADAVRAANPRADLLLRHGSDDTPVMAYVWAHERPGRVVARFFFPKAGLVAEDPATGSACANLGGWMLATSRPLPVRLEVAQGDLIGRPSRLFLEVTADRQIRVAGDVIELGRGEIALP
jgi:PhzF family phenazine biosynthesis protein